MSMSHDKERIRSANPIERVIGEYTQLKKSGPNTYQGLCPLHEENSPSFTVYTATQSFFCFGCGVGGDVFRLVQLKEGIDFKEALDRLAHRTYAVTP